MTQKVNSQDFSKKFKGKNFFEKDNEKKSPFHCVNGVCDFDSGQRIIKIRILPANLSALNKKRCLAVFFRFYADKNFFLKFFQKFYFIKFFLIFFLS